MTFVDETKGLASGSDYESISEYATPPPETRSTDATSVFSTPIADAQAGRQPEHTPTGQLDRVAQREGRGYSGSLNALNAFQSVTTPFPRRPWEERVLSNTPELSQDSLPLVSSNPLSIDGILNKSTTDHSLPLLHQSFSRAEESPSIPPIYSERPVWPLEDPAEALLLQHFVQNLAIWVWLCRSVIPLHLTY